MTHPGGPDRGATQQGNPAPHRRRWHLPRPHRHPPPGRHSVSRTARRMDRRPPLPWPRRARPRPRHAEHAHQTTRTGILMSSTFDSGERDHRKSLSSPTRLCSPPSWTCTAARGCASGGDWIPRRSGSPTAATCAFGERKGEPRLGSVPTRRPGADRSRLRTGAYPPQAVSTLRPWRAPNDRRCRAHRSTRQLAVGGEVF